MAKRKRTTPTDKQLEVLRLHVLGLSSSEVADALCLNKRTIDSHLRSLYQVLSVNSLMNAVREATRLGYIDPMRIWLGGACYCVMFGAGPPAPHQTAARERYKRTTLAFMGGHSLQSLATDLGIRFVGRHTRAVYSRLAVAGRLTEQEYENAHEWGDWGALRPQFWLGEKRTQGAPPRDMLFDPNRLQEWPYRYMAAMADIYGFDALRATGIFLDADIRHGWEALQRFAAIARGEGIRVYLNGGQFRGRPANELLAFDGLFYEAVQVGRPYENESRVNAERLLARTELGRMWVGIQVRFSQEPNAEQIATWSEWFMKSRRTPNQSVTFVVQPQGALPRELPCPDQLDPLNYVRANPVPPPRGPGPSPT